jgi:hypothetical protein
MIGSYKTAIARRNATLPYRELSKVVEISHPALDYGCGKSIDYIFMHADRYDPHWHPEEPEKNYYKTIFCTYVLNVVREDEEADLINKILLCLAPGGKAYLTVRRDLKKDGETSRGYQRNVELDLPIIMEKRGAFCTYLMEYTHVIQNRSLV